ncbi:MAG: SDR family NAD(P)-dependent oxidoreductase, partial [Pseudomonas sp.]|nr:SDR family NAD(P)-dependent oxidoreductase [Pseudomonas sp.]
MADNGGNFMQHVVITGANRGIGLELARLYAARGDRVTGVCRNSSAELDQVASTVVAGVDVTIEADVARLAESLAGQEIHLLINNAGLLQDEKLGSIDFDSIRVQMEVNAYAP